MGSPSIAVEFALISLACFVSFIDCPSPARCMCVTVSGIWVGVSRREEAREESEDGVCVSDVV
eukprot:127910-Pleurochrysis_carterae.AAC.9